MEQVTRLASRPEFKAALIQELADIDAQIEPLERRAEAIRRELGMLGLEYGVEE